MKMGRKANGVTTKVLFVVQASSRPRGKWHCDNGLCVEEDRLCDGYNDCNDGSDELPQNCPSN